MSVLLDKLADLDPKIMLADGYDDCLVGLTLRDDQWVALYDANLIIEKLSQVMTDDEAIEFFEFNIMGAYVGPRTPVFKYID